MVEILVLGGSFRHLSQISNLNFAPRLQNMLVSGNLSKRPTDATDTVPGFLF